MRVFGAQATEEDPRYLQREVVATQGDEVQWLGAHYVRLQSRTATPMVILKRLTDFPKAKMLVYFANEASVRWSGSGQIDKALDDLLGTDEFKGVATPGPGEAPISSTTCTSSGCMRVIT